MNLGPAALIAALIPSAYAVEDRSGTGEDEAQKVQEGDITQWIEYYRTDRNQSPEGAAKKGERVRGGKIKAGNDDPMKATQDLNDK